MNRRRFLQVGAAASVGMAAAASGALADGFTVGVGRSTDAYAATARAIDASGNWPGAALAGRRVLVKPNLVSPFAASTGATTDPEVVRAVVDRALGSGAAEVLIVESGRNGANFSECGYDPFSSYDPSGRVRLLDLSLEPVAAAPVPGGGLAYRSITVPLIAVDPTVGFISVGKMKTHNEAVATLSTKNLFALPAVDRYISQPGVGRFAMHDRGLSQAIVDLALLRPIHFAVIDGMWGMEGWGPLFGTPMRMDTVLAGANSVAVDRVALAAMQIPQASVRYLAYASRVSLGPADLAGITVSGDTLRPQPFDVPVTPPAAEYPRLVPSVFRPSAGQRTSIALWYGEACLRRLEVVRLFDDSTTVDLVRTIADYATVAGGYEWSAWDGRDDAGAMVPPGGYAVHVRCYSLRGSIRHSDAVSSVGVAA